MGNLKQTIGETGNLKQKMGDLKQKKNRQNRQNGLQRVKWAKDGQNG